MSRSRFQVALWSGAACAALITLGCAGKDEEDQVCETCDEPDATMCVAQEVAVPAHGICDRPVSNPQNDVEYALCVEYTGQDPFPIELEDECGSHGGTYYPAASGRACTIGGAVGRCTKGSGEPTETVLYYYPSRWDATTAAEHCDQEDGEFEATDESICSAVCGNGIPETPGEACDDGNLVDGDGCDAACALESACVAQEVSVPPQGICDRPLSNPLNDVEYALCVEYTGDGTFPVDIEEQCESHGGTHYPFASGRACTIGGAVGRCTKGSGDPDSETVLYYYPSRWDATTAAEHCDQEDGEFEATDDSICPAACGNGIAETPGEACDDGDLDVGDGCDAACALE